MNSKTWIILGVVAGLFLISCFATMVFMVVPSATKNIETTQMMDSYNERSRYLEMAQNFQTDLDGGGTIAFTEIGIRKADNIEVWTSKTGWKTVPSSSVNPGFDVKYGYYKGVVRGRDHANFSVSCEMGKSETKSNGEFVIDIDNMSYTDIGIFFSDGAYKKRGSWKPRENPSGAWDVHSDFKLDLVSSVMYDAELWPFNPVLGKKRNVPGMKGLMMLVDVDQMDPFDRKVIFTLKSGEKKESFGSTFYDEYQDVWWVFPYDGNLSDIVQADYMGRDSHYIFISDVDFSQE